MPVTHLGVILKVGQRRGRFCYDNCKELFEEDEGTGPEAYAGGMVLQTGQEVSWLTGSILNGVCAWCNSKLVEGKPDSWEGNWLGLRVPL